MGVVVVSGSSFPSLKWCYFCLGPAASCKSNLFICGLFCRSLQNSPPVNCPNPIVVTNKEREVCEALSRVEAGVTIDKTDKFLLLYYYVTPNVKFLTLWEIVPQKVIISGWKNADTARKPFNQQQVATHIVTQRWTNHSNALLIQRGAEL